MPSQVASVVDPLTQIASKFEELQPKETPTSKKVCELIAGAFVGRSCTVIPLPFALASTLLAGVIGQLMPDGFQVPELEDDLVRVNAVSELLNLFP